MKGNTSFLKNVFKLLLSTFALGELITLIFFIFVKADFAFNLKAVPGITFSSFMIILLCSFIVSLANLIFKLPKLNYALKLILHSIIICLSVILALSLMNSGSSLGSAAVFVLVLLFFLVYFLAFSIYALIKKRKKNKNATEKPAYTKQF